MELVPWLFQVMDGLPHQAKKQRRVVMNAEVVKLVIISKYCLDLETAENSNIGFGDG